MKFCSVDECAQNVLAKGLCCLHYGRFRKHGSTDKPERKPRESRRCNLMLGAGNDNPETLQAGVKYLLEHQ